MDEIEQRVAHLEAENVRLKQYIVQLKEILLDTLKVHKQHTTLMIMLAINVAILYLKIW